jgi:hypothetical protein
LVFARSRRPTYIFGAAALAVAAALLVAAVWLLELGNSWAAVPPAMLAGVALAVFFRMVRRLRHWPPSRLGLFADRLVLVQGPVEMQAPWDLVETATLAASPDAGGMSWTELKLSDRLTLKLRQGRSITLRPVVFGLDPAACRDVVLRLRDDAALRSRLPEFDSMLDLVARPLQTGDLIRPQL